MALGSLKDSALRLTLEQSIESYMSGKHAGTPGSEAYGTRKHVGPQEPHSLAGLFELSMQVSHQCDE